MRLGFFIGASILVASCCYAKDILLFDKLNGKSKNLVDNQPGIVSKNTQFVKTVYGKGFFSGKGTGDRSVTYKGKGNFNPLQGTLELWIKTGPGFGKRKHHEHLASLAVDGNNCIGLYYNWQEKRLIFWMKDSDTPGKNIHQKDYNTFMPGPRLDWQPNQRHHVAITWQKDYEVMYVDGKAVGMQEYRGQIFAEFNDKSKIVIGRDSYFIIDAVRIWNYARAPRKLDQEPSLADAKETFQFKSHPAAYGKNNKLAVTSGNCELRITAKNGLPSMLVDKSKKVKLIWGGSELFFNQKKIKLNGNAKLADNQISGSFKALNESGINVKAKYSKEKNCVKLNLTLKNKSNKLWQKDVAIAFKALTEDAMGFMAADGNPFAIKTGMPSYCGTKKGYQVIGGPRPVVYIPAAVVYQPKKNYGFTITQPMDVREYVTIDFGQDFLADQLTMINSKVKIKPGQSRTLTYYFSVHPGDWRAGLGFINNRFPATFQPGRKNYAKIDGGMTIGGPSDVKYLKNMSDLGIVYREISSLHGKQMAFGEYVPDNPNAVTLKFFTSLGKQINNLHKADILGLLYIQARECKRIEFAQKRFPESLQYDANGKIIESYSFGAKMLCPENSSWFKHLVLQSKKVLEHVPNADGFFFDNSWDKEYANVINAVANVAHSKGLYIATNGASSNCAAASDSIMAEGTRRALGGLAYLGLAQPITYIPINHYGGFGIKREREIAAPALPENLQLDLKACLLKGAFYAFNYRGAKYFGSESMKMFKAYLPLQDALKGKKWYLIAHALRIPKNIKANIFENRNGELVVYLVSKGFPFRSKPAKPFKISVRVPGRRITSAVARRIEDSVEANIPFEKNGNSIEIKVSNHCSITMLKLK
jgi:hypothetical protein